MLIPMTEVILDSIERNTKLAMLKRAGYPGTLVTIMKRKLNSVQQIKVRAYTITEVETAARMLKTKNATSWIAAKALVSLAEQMKKYKGVTYDLKGNELPVLTNKQKQVISLATTFVYSFLQDATLEHKDVKKLDKTLCNLTAPFIHDVPTQLDNAYKYLEKLTEGKDIVCNELALGVNLAMMIAEMNIFNDTLNKSILEKANKINTELEKQLGHEEGYKNALKLVHKFTKDI